MDTEQVFQKVKTLGGYDPKAKLSVITDPASFAEELNTFYIQFDTIHCSKECEALLGTLSIL